MLSLHFTASPGICSAPMRAVAAMLVTLVACSSPAPQPDAPASPWSLGIPGFPESARLPVPRLEPGVTAMGDQLVVVGGFDTDLMAGLHITKRVDVLDTLTGTWSRLPDAPVAWTHLQLAAVGTTLYLLGGLEGQQYIARGEAFALDTQTPGATWRPIAPLPAGLERGSAGVVVVAPRIYLFGGASTTGALASNIFYDVSMDAWCPGAACPPDQELPDLPLPRSHPAAARRVDGTFVVAGGLGGLASDTAADDTWLLPPTAQVPTGQWQTAAPMPTERGGCAYGVILGQLVCAGGEAGTSALPTTEGYDLMNGTWATLAPMPVPTAGTQGAAIGQRLFVPGGARVLQFEPTDTVYVFSPLDTAARAELGSR
jgi:hypothetical protein